MAESENGQVSRTMSFDCRIGPVSDLSAFEEDNFYILASSETSNHAVALWPDKSTSNQVLMTSFTGHSAGIKCISSAPKSGSFFVTGSIDRTCRLWRWNASMDGAASHIFPPYHRDASSTNTVDISPDEGCFAAGGKDHTISIWDVNDNSHPIHSTRTGGGSVSHIRFNPYDPSSFAACRRGVLIFIDKRQKFKETQAYKDAHLHVCTWRDAHQLVFASGANLRSIDTRSPNKSINIAALKSPISGLAFDFERKTLAVSNSEGLYLFSDNYKCRKGPKPAGKITTVAYSHVTDRLIYAKGSGEIAMASHLVDSDAKDNSIHSSPSKANVSRDSKSIREREDKSKDDRDKTRGDQSTRSSSRSSSGESLNNCYEEITEETIFKKASEILKKQNDRAASARPLWDVKCGKILYSVSISPDNQAIIAGSSDRKVIYWKKGTRTTFPLVGHTGEVRTTAFSPDGSYFISGGDDAKVLFWPHPEKIVNPCEIAPTQLAGHRDHVKSVCINNDGLTFASSSADTQVLLWSCRNSHPELSKTLKVHSSMVNAVRFHPFDSKLMATASKGSGIVLIDDRIPSPMIISASKDAPNLCLAWHPLNPVYLATGTWTSVRVWDIRNTASAFQFCKTPFPCSNVNYHPSGHQLIGSIVNCAAVKMYSCDTSSYKLEEISSINDTYSRSIWAAIFNSTGTQIITASGAPGKITVWPNRFVTPLTAQDTSSVSTGDLLVNHNKPQSPSTGSGDAGPSQPRRTSTVSTSSMKDQTPVSLLKNDSQSEVTSKADDSFIRELPRSGLSSGAVAATSSATASTSSASTAASASSPIPGPSSKTKASAASEVDACKTNGVAECPIKPSIPGTSGSGSSSSPQAQASTSSTKESSSSNLSDTAVATVLDAKICPIRRTIGQLEFKLNQALQTIKSISDSNCHLKTVLASRMEVEASQSRLIEDMHSTLKQLDAKVASLNPQNTPQVFDELHETVDKLQTDMDRVKTSNAKTHSLVAELKSNLNQVTSNLIERSRDKCNSSTLPLASGLVVVVAAVLSYYYFARKRMLT